MKHYKFLGLKHQPLAESEDKLVILSASSAIMGSDESDYTYSKKGIELLQKALKKDQFYYVIHDVQKYKGKQMVWSGHTVISTKTDIQSFIPEELNKQDLRPIRIMATLKPDFVIRVTDEVVFCLHKKRN